MSLQVESSWTTREPQPDDAAAMVELFIERRADTSPGNPAYDIERIAWHREHGIDKYGNLINLALTDPQHNFLRVAVLGSTLIGYVCAEAAAGEQFTEYKGLIVARFMEGMGVGQALEARRYAWAQTVARPIRGKIVTANDRSMDFFKRQGFVQVGFSRPTPEIPLPFNIMGKDLD